MWVDCKWRRRTVCVVFTSVQISFNLQYFEDQRLIQRASEHIEIPPFYFPNGEPVPSEENEAILERLREVFQTMPEGKARRDDMISVTKVS